MGAGGMLDVVVVGAGPGGSTTGHLLAAQGLRVLILDKEDFPRFHIGESLLPCDLPLFERLGMDMRDGPFLHKQGAEFIDEGHFARHIRQMRMIYGERRAALVESLETLLADELELHGDEAGMHLTVTLKKPGNDREIALRAAKQDLWLWPLSPAFQQLKPRHGFILGFGGVPASQMPKAVRLMREVLKER